MRLYIAEKPSMARELAACLKNPVSRNGYIQTDAGLVTWLYGHVLEQAEPAAYDPKYKTWRAEDLPIVPKVWKLEVRPDAAKQFNIVAGLIKRADEIVHAGDPDREGQLLVDEVLDFVGNTKPVKRILLNALDAESILTANSNLRDNGEFVNLKQSALARSRADWLIGMNLSRAYTLAARRRGHDIVLPIGRVKTPTLALVVRRDREIKNFKPIDFFKILATFVHENGEFTATFKPSKKMLKLSAFDAEGRLVDKDFAAELVKNFSTAPLDGIISSCKTTERKEPPPLPFSLSTLQIAAGKAFGYSPQQVLDAAQKLYEMKLTTYPRSDCEFLPTNQFKDATAILSHLVTSTDAAVKKLAVNANAAIKSRAWNDKKISAHHAIIPTRKKLTQPLPAVEQSVYNLIAKNYAVQFHAPHVYDETVVVVDYKGETFRVTGKVVKQPGWREFYVVPKPSKSDDKAKPSKSKAALKPRDEDESESPLPQMSTGDAVTHKQSALKQGTTTPPKPFTAASLVQGMKEIHKYVKNPDAQKQLKDVYGIGTEATRAAIIDDLIQRKFLTVTKKILHPTDRAYLLIDALPDEMTYPDATAVWEDKLHSMSDGDGTLEAFLAGQVDFTRELVNAAANANFSAAEGVFKCPNCGSALVKRHGKNGDFWGCTNYPRCRTTFDDKDGKPDFDGKKFRHTTNYVSDEFAPPTSDVSDDFNPDDFEPIISSADFD